MVEKLPIAVVVRPPSWVAVIALACVVEKACTSVVVSVPICAVVRTATWVEVSVLTCVVVRLLIAVVLRPDDLAGRELVEVERVEVVGRQRVELGRGQTRVCVVVSASSCVVEKLPTAVVVRPPSWVAVIALACVVENACTSVVVSVPIWAVVRTATWVEVSVLTCVVVRLVIAWWSGRTTCAVENSVSVSASRLAPTGVELGRGQTLGLRRGQRGELGGREVADRRGGETAQAASP